MTIDIQEKLDKKLQERLEEEAREEAKKEEVALKAAEISGKQDELLRHNICPKCGEDAHKAFSILCWFSFTHKKMKCSSCGFKKYIEICGAGPNEYY